MKRLSYNPLPHHSGTYYPQCHHRVAVALTSKPPLWARFRAWLRYAHSPLALRRARNLYRLRHQNKHPLLTLLAMFIPYPSLFFPIPELYPLRTLIEDTKNNTHIIASRFGDIHNLRAIPIWRMRDTPLRSIYRLYELHLADHYELMGWEIQYFFKRPHWKLQSIPDPKDPDPLRYAIVASIVEELYDAVNWRLSLGLRRNGKHIYREEDGDPWPLLLQRNYLLGQGELLLLIKIFSGFPCHPNRSTQMGI
ncbi:hypothetical protein N7454_010903 [Penicillium verhagenii]|nr:hypothetical protein N7454_010903 [Penicillium verhagenii]